CEWVGRADRLDAGARHRLDRYQEGVDSYRARRFDDALKIFAGLAEEGLGDGPLSLYLERSRQALPTPPPADWDGVHVAPIKESSVPGRGGSAGRGRGDGRARGPRPRLP